ncbi:MAG: methyltransferase domain-containing protein [Anaerolineae bacterium]|nr:methyltransferase domain-containing protein [Anaerolineae bacterium]
MAEACRIYEQPALRRVAGDVLRPGGLSLTRYALAQAALLPGARVLDLGCGVGTTAAVCRGEFNLGAVGLDVSGGMLAEARGQHPGLPLVQAPGARLPFRDGSLDAVLAECTLSLMPDPDAVMAEVRRVLRAGGWFAVSDLYTRAPDNAPSGVTDPHTLPPAGCLQGACARADFEARLAAHGFIAILWEDHTRALKTFTARLIFEHGSLAGFWQCATGNPAIAEPIRQAVARAHPGYFLAIAQKTPSFNLCRVSSESG